MPLIGYARVSTEDQTPLPQIQELRAAGCTEILEEQASGGSRTRPILARLMEQLRSGDTLVVVRIDRLARSLSHLLDVIERLEAKGAHFGPLLDSIDTASPQGSFSLQILGAAAEFERALIRERTKGGFQSARAEGRFGGNPGLKARDARAIRKARAARVKNHFQKLNGTAEQPSVMGAGCPTLSPEHAVGRCAPRGQLWPPEGSTALDTGSADPSDKDVCEKRSSA